MKTSIARTLAALSATNEAILYAQSPDELYRKVCEAAFSSGDFLATAVFLHELGTGLLRFAAGFGEDVPRLRTPSRYRPRPAHPRARGSAGGPFATSVCASATIT